MISAKEIGVGFVSIDEMGYWPGGRHHIQQIIQSVALVDPQARLPMRVVWWGRRNDADTSFDAVKECLEGEVVVKPPQSFVGRIIRRVRRFIQPFRGFEDLHLKNGVGVLFPTQSCEHPGVPLLYLLTDLQFKRRPDLSSPKVRSHFETEVRSKLASAELVVVASRDVGNDLARYFPEYSSKVRLLPCYCIPGPQWFELDPLQVAREYSLRRHYFLISNQFTEHKNYACVFEAVRLLRDRGIDVQIVCTGHAENYKGSNHLRHLQRWVAEHDLDANIRILGFLDRKVQLGLMRGARAVVQPSLFEGWSNPVEEARALGQELLLSDISIHREKLNDGLVATLIEAESPEAWASALAHASSSMRVTQVLTEEMSILRAKERAKTTGRIFVDIAREAMERVNATRNVRRRINASSNRVVCR